MTQTSEQIAIIGLAGRFPGAETVAEFWRNLERGVEASSSFSEQQLLERGESPERIADPHYVRSRPTLEHAGWFDPEFFGYSALEAEWIDPQQRLFLECCWEALESAGYDPALYRGWVGVFAGSSFNSYLLHHLGATSRRLQDADAFELRVASEKDYVASRVAYKLDLKGPAVSVQTACSTSLVAVHQACQSLLAGECDMALAGGVSIDYPNTGYVHQPEGVRSPDGRCRPFDRDANGCVFGDAAGVVVLKRREDAERDGDYIHALILGSAVNNDGAAKVGYSAPSLDGQARVITMAQLAAGVDADSIGYVEAHGTATPLGDPIEVAALSKAFRRHTRRTGFCALGSVKGNIGHTGPAAGVVSLIKTVQALVHGRIPPSLHFRAPNPEIDFGQTPFFVNAVLRDWPRSAVPRRAGVSAFGIGGTNAHVVVEEAPQPLARAPHPDLHQIVPFTGRSEAAVRAQAERLRRELGEQPELVLADVARTFQVGRRHFANRAAVVASSISELSELLSVPGELQVTSAQDTPPRVVFMFTGQGPQYPGMARELHAHEPAFRDALDRCASGLVPLLGSDIRELLLPEDTSSDSLQRAHERLSSMEWAQPGMFVLQYALVALLRDWGITAHAVFGHSLGELAAACVAGVFTLEQGLALVAGRGRAMARQPEGAMLAVPLDAGELRGRLPDGVHLAVLNAPGMCVVSGRPRAIESYALELESRGLAPKRLNIPRAGHSPLMQGAAESLRQLLDGVRLAEPELPFLSSMKGEWIAGDELTRAEYWTEHVVRPVLFSEAVAKLDRDLVLLEIGPGRGLCTLVELHGPEWAGRAIPCLPGAKDAGHARKSALEALGALFARGVVLDWQRPFAATAGRRIPLPTYPFERRRCVATAPEPARPASNQRPFERWFFTPAFRSAALAVSPVPELARSGKWLVIRDPDCVAGTFLEQRLAKLGQDVASLCDRGELAAGFERLHAGGFVPDYVLDCRLLSDAVEGEHGAPQRDQDLSNLDRVFDLARALSKLPPAERRLCVLGQGAYGHALGGVQRPDHAALFAAYHCLGYEIPSLCVRLVDLAPTRTPREREQLLERALAELASSATEPRIALGPARRLVPSLDALELAERAAETRLCEGGVYVITGGLNGIGWEIAQHLAATYRARLALLGRSAFPERARWADYPRDPRARAQIVEQIERIEELERAGARFLLLQADVAEQEAATRALAATLSAFGRIDGAFHAAGLAAEGLSAGKSRAAVAAVVGAKTRGTEYLAEFLERCGSRFLMLFSSSMALLAGPGQAEYAAANQYMNGFAEAYQGRLEPIAVLWGAWKHAGIAARRGLAAHAPLLPGRSWDRSGEHPLCDRDRSETSGRRCRSKQLCLHQDWVVAEHRYEDDGVFPGTAYVAAACAAAQAIHPDASAVEITNLSLVSLCRVSDGRPIELGLELEPEGDRHRFRFLRREPGASQAPELVAEGRLGAAGSRSRRIELDELRRRAIATDPARLFERINRSGVIRWGPRWNCLREVYVDGADALGRFEIDPRFVSDLDHHALHPALLDAATALVSYLVADDQVYLPASYERVTCHAPLPAVVWSHVRRRAAAPGARGDLVCDAVLSDSAGRVLVEIDGYRAVKGPPVRRMLDDEALSPEQGMKAIERILAHTGFRQVLVLPEDVSEDLQRQRPLKLSLARNVEASPEASPGEGADAGSVRDKVVRIWRQELGLDAADLDASFFDLGGHSLMALRLQAKLYRATGVQVSIRQLFSAPTLRGLLGCFESVSELAEEDAPAAVDASVS